MTGYVHERTIPILGMPADSNATPYAKAGILTPSSFRIFILVKNLIKYLLQTIHLCFSMANVMPDDEKASDVATIANLDSLCKGETDDELDAPRNRKILWKTDLVIMPLVTFGMTLAFLDEVYPSSAAFTDS